MYSYRLKRAVPLLTETEFAPIERSLQSHFGQIKRYLEEHPGFSIGEARANCCADAMESYERVSGVRLAHPDQLYWVRMSLYGAPCPTCGRPFRTPRAKLCAACGFELAEGEVAGPLRANET